MDAIDLAVIFYMVISTLYLSYELSSCPSISPFRSVLYIKLYNSLNTIYGKNNNIHSVVSSTDDVRYDDDDDDDDNDDDDDDD